jgi:hypothetical protein
MLVKCYHYKIKISIRILSTIISKWLPPLKHVHFQHMNHYKIKLEGGPLYLRQSIKSKSQEPQWFVTTKYLHKKSIDTVPCALDFIEDSRRGIYMQTTIHNSTNAKNQVKWTAKTKAKWSQVKPSEAKWSQVKPKPKAKSQVGTQTGDSSSEMHAKHRF